MACGPILIRNVLVKAIKIINDIDVVDFEQIDNVITFK